MILGLPSADGVQHYYAIAHGYEGFQGVVYSWSICKILTDKVPGATFKRSSNRDDAQAFIRDYNAAILLRRAIWDRKGSTRTVAEPEHPPPKNE